MRCHRSSTSSQQVITLLRGLQIHLTYLFLPSLPLSSYGTSLPRLAPNLHLHAGIALITKQGAGSITCTGANAITQPAPLSRALLCFTHQPLRLQRCLTLDKLLLVPARTWPGDSLKLPRKMPLPRRVSQYRISSICRLTRLNRKRN